MRFSFKLSIIALLTASLFVGGCDKRQAVAPTYSKAEVEEEMRIQRQMIKDEAAHQAQSSNVSLADHERRLTTVATRISDASLTVCHHITGSKEHCRFDFELVKEKEKENGEEVLNAFADGEKVYITTGMMQFLRTDSELGAVLGHEVAHNVLAHVDYKKENLLIGSVLGTILDTVAASQGIDTSGGLTRIGQHAGNLAYSVEYEQEADYVGLYIMKHAGYDIHQAPDIWRRMSIVRKDSAFIRTTHPSNPERFIALKKVIAEIEQKERGGQALLPKLKPKES